MERELWLYSQPSWWIDRLTNAASLVGLEFPNADSDSATLDRIDAEYSAKLRELAASTTTTPEQARDILFLAKSLRKWKLPVCGADHSKLRCQQAMAGFLQRNSEASSSAYTPPHTEEMRRILSRWLPRTERSVPVFGRFGPGAVSEGWQHPQRFCRLHDALNSGLNPDQPTEYFRHTDTMAGVSRLCAVPKTWSKDRLITVEPCIQGYRQQYVRNVLLESIHSGPLRGSAMDLGYTDGQAIQRRLAVKASRTGDDVTIDLSDASDRISWEAVQAVFPRWVLDLLWGCRTSMVRTPGGRPTPLHIYAGMGNATTFVVETLFFSAYVVAVQRTYGLRPYVSTFGDDIITDQRTYERLLLLGDSPWFKINLDKSFGCGDLLRESCGVFAFKGNDISSPKIDGYAPNWSGRLGVSDLHCRLAESQSVLQRALAFDIAQLGLIPNWPFYVEGYPSIVDWSTEWSALPRSRINVNFQVKEVELDIEASVQRYFPCADPFVDQELDQNVLGLDSNELALRYARERNPPAAVWLDAVLSGACSTAPRALNARCTWSRVAFPTGKRRLIKRWLRTTPGTACRRKL